MSSESFQEKLYLMLSEISDREIQEGLLKMPNDDLVKSLIDAPADIMQRIMDNLSPRGGQLLTEDVVSTRDHARVDDGLGDFRKVDNSDQAKEKSCSVFFEVLKTTDKLRTQ